MRKTLFVLFSLMLFLLTGCAQPEPVVAILSPENGSIVEIGEVVDLEIEASESGGAGLDRVELYANGDLLSIMNPSPEETEAFAYTLPWMPAGDGYYSVMAIAFAPDNVASEPMTVNIAVEAPGGAESSDGMEGMLMGKAIALTNMRTGPDESCPIWSTLEAETEVSLIEFSTDAAWVQGVIPGSNQIGWIWLENLQILGDASILPVGDVTGCGDQAAEGPYCGDGNCDADEDCSTCPADCGVCVACGDGTCDSGVGENCANCSADCGSCCGNAICEPGLGENCNTCEPDCGSCCGNGTCEGEYGENAFNCLADCPLEVITICGDGICNGDETAFSCFLDCGTIIEILPYCGDGTCDYPEETLMSCPDDCALLPYWCGNGECEEGEDINNCFQDCPSVCGDGICEGMFENVILCPQDCQ